MTKRYNYMMDLIISIVSLVGLILNFNLFKSPIGILYYTIFSNMLCFIFYFTVLVLKITGIFKTNRLFIKMKGLVLVSLICTFLIYNFFMVPTGQVSAYDGHFIVSCFVHIFTPILVVLDCIINGKNKMLEYTYILDWLIAIIIYGVIVIIYQHCGGFFIDGLNYPYFNFNIDDYGYLLCIFFNFLILVLYSFICLIVILINRKNIGNR